jgi:hypothetical protein
MSRIQISTALCAIATASYVLSVAPANGQNVATFYGGINANPPQGAMPYGNGRLSPRETTTLMYLEFPQSYDAIKNSLGFPSYRTAAADYYQLPDGRWVMLTYNQENKAIAMQVGDYY